MVLSATKSKWNVLRTMQILALHLGETYFMNVQDYNNCLNNLFRKKHTNIYSNHASNCLPEFDTEPLPVNNHFCTLCHIFLPAKSFVLFGSETSSDAEYNMFLLNSFKRPFKLAKILHGILLVNQF